MHESEPQPGLVLLREYATRGSERAFEEVVRRYVDFVYSVALRRVGGDRQAAKDACQTVFFDLARQVRSGRGPLASEASQASLGGWLHRHTCLVTATMRRSEDRRKRREQKAAAMNVPSSEDRSSPSAWEELAPELDAAVQQLSPVDRDAILLRYFERRDLATVGTVLGISEDAAQKRVQRALQRLRGILGEQGVSLSLAALGLLLEERSVAAAPVGTAGRVAIRALTSPPKAPSWPGKSLGSGASPGRLITGKTGLGLVGTIALVTWLVVLTPWDAMRPSGFDARVAVESASEPRALDSTTSRDLDQILPPAPHQRAGVSLSIAASVGEPTLSLRFLDRETGRPVPRVPVEWRAWEGERLSHGELVGNPDGQCEIPILAGITRLQLTTRLDGYADTRLLWRPERGDSIPENLVVSLDRPIPVGGMVLDADGQPVLGAKVGFNDGTPDEASESVVSHHFAWVETETDINGRWVLERVAASRIATLRGSAKHPDHLPSTPIDASQTPSVIADLTNRTLIFRLGHPMMVRGRVINEGGQPVAGARVSVGDLGTVGRGMGISRADGTFSIPGDVTSPTTLTAEAEGFAPTTIALSPEALGHPLEIVVHPGKRLVLRVVDREGRPLAGAHVWFDTLGPPESRMSRREEPLIQADFNPITDADGLAIWEHAPDRELAFDIHKRGYQRLLRAKVRPDGGEHRLTLAPALRIRGTVRDAASGQPITRFRITAGAPLESRPADSPAYFWGRQEEHRGLFHGGEFSQVFEEPILWGVPNPAYVLRIEAEDYAPTITRSFQPNEGDVVIDVAMRRSPAVRVAVRLPDGSPAGGADVARLTADSRYKLGPNGFERTPETPVLVTDGEGVFRLVADDEVSQILVAHRGGYAETTPESLRTDPILRLQPWGTIEGTVWSRGQPVVGRTFTIDCEGRESGLILEAGAFEATTDAAGRFRLHGLPPRNLRLWQYFDDQDKGITGGSGRTMHPVHQFEMPAGAGLTVDLGREDRPVRLRPVWNAEPAQAFRFVTLLTPRPMPSFSVATNPAARREWMNRPDVRAASRTGRSHPLRRGEDGSWLAEGVPPGEYLLHVGAGSAPAGPAMRLPTAQATVLIPSGNPEEEVDLGDVPVVMKN